ncbi:MAG: hypothetical protein Q9218_004649 [Villophora microphyllina]
MSVASRWFVPDAEFLAATEDYAVVGQPETIGRPFLPPSEMFDPYEGVFDEDEEEQYDLTVKDELTDANIGEAIGLGVSEQLLYADVDSNNPDHKEIGKRITKEESLAEESEKGKAVKDKLIEHLVSLHSPVSDDDEAPDEEGMKKYRAYLVQLLSRAHGIVSREMIDYVLSLEDQGDRREILNILSGQSLRKTQRPVMLLIGMIDSYSSEKIGVKEGWKVAYDFYKDRVIIKPFFSDKTHHPLTEKWDADLPDDGVSFTGRPSAFVERFWKLHAEIQNKEHEKDITAFGRRVLVYYFTMRWIVGHWKALGAIKQVEGDRPMSHENLIKLTDAKKTILQAVGNIKLKLDVKLQKRPTNDKGSVRVFEYMQALLEDHESIIREDVVKVKEAGREAAAQNAAKLYGQLLAQLRSFNLDSEQEI